jgi:two-component system cell cycle response regulator
MFSFSKPVVLLASPDTSLTGSVKSILESLDLRVQIVTGGDAVLDAAISMPAGGIVLLDAQLAGIASGQMMAAIQESGVHERCAVAMIAEKTPGLNISSDLSGEWLARLAEGVIDDIVPRNADAAAWQTHISTMQRGHRLACELEQLRAGAVTDVQHDGLTGVFNRGTMLSLLFRETDRVQRLCGTLCCVIFDIDDFGHWNSKLGMEACDQLLREVAARTGRILRSYDMFGRLGRDEFLLGLPGCSIVSAEMLAERLRLEIFGELFEVETERGELKKVRLTACFGVTSSRGRSPVVVLREVEQALAHARLSGPDAIRCANETPLPADAPQLFIGPETVSW